MAENDGLCRFARGCDIGGVVIKCNSPEVAELVRQIERIEYNQLTENNEHYTDLMQDLKDICPADAPCKVNKRANYTAQLNMAQEPVRF
jgi:hypothetical protein